MKHLVHKLLLLIFALNLGGNALSYSLHSEIDQKKHIHSAASDQDDEEGCASNHCHHTGIFGHTSSPVHIPTFISCEPSNNLSEMIQIADASAYLSSHLLEGPYTPPR